MRVLVFSTLSRRRLQPWVDAIQSTSVVTEVLTIGPEDWPLLSRRANGSMTHAGELLSRIRAWQADCAVAIGAPHLPPLVHSIPRMGTLAVRLGAGPDEPPGFHELWHGEEYATATVQWIGIDRRGVGAGGRVPIYCDDSIGLVKRRLEEMGCLLLASALTRVAEGGSPGVTYVTPIVTAELPSLVRRCALHARVAWRRWRARASVFLVAKTAAVLAWLAIVRPLRDAWRTLTRRHPVRIYTLHRVTWLCRDGMTVSPDTFRRQMEYVQRRHDVVSLDRAIALLAQGTRLRRPVAAVTFDDGYESVATAAEPTLTSLGMVAACFVCPDMVSVGGTFAHDATCVSRDWLRVMNWPALRTLHKIGWHVGSHTSSHARVSEIHGDALLRELWNPRAALRDEVAPVPVAFAYPFGGRADVTPDAVELARKCGYVAVLADFGGENAPNAADKFFLNRIDIGGGHDPLMWRAMIDGLDFNRWRSRR